MRDLVLLNFVHLGIPYDNQYCVGRRSAFGDSRLALIFEYRIPSWKVSKGESAGGMETHQNLSDLLLVLSCPLKCWKSSQEVAEKNLHLFYLGR